MLGCEPGSGHRRVLRTSFPIARMRRSAAGNVVDLYWGDRNIRFHICDPLAHSDRADELTGQADHDPPPASCADGPPWLPVHGTSGPAG